MQEASELSKKQPKKGKSMEEKKKKKKKKKKIKQVLRAEQQGAESLGEYKRNTSDTFK